MANLDSKLAVDLSDKLERDQHTADSQIEVIDNNGVITLSGTALSNKARAAAVQIALSHPDVLSVINDVEIDGETTDAVIPIAPLKTDPAFRTE